MNWKLAVIICLLTANPGWADDLPVPARIEQSMLSDQRPEADRARNVYRHPVGTLTFFGLEDGMTVMEIWPGGGWYTQILAPTIRHHGQFIVANYDADVPDQPEYRYRLQLELLDMFSQSPELYDQVAVVPFSPPASSSLGEADSIDLLMTFRNTHGWISDGIAEAVYREFARVLKPGGILGVVQHRAPAGADPVASASTGYVPEAAVIELARQAGLYLEAKSEVNANPRDTHDWPEGVWTLPPSLAVCGEIVDEAEQAACVEKYVAIGESDRMTLRFRKP